MIEAARPAPPCSSPERMATVTRSARRLHLEEDEYPDPEDLQETHW